MSFPLPHRRHRGPRFRPSRGSSLRCVLAPASRAALLLALLAAVQYVRPLPAIPAEPLLPAALALPGSPPDLPWPDVGAAAVAVGDHGPVLAHGDPVPRPVASIAKVMTALVVLDGHPLAPGEEGPLLAVGEEDVARYLVAQGEGESVLPVAAGQRLSEYQLLQALLIPSANNAADLLARWDAGSAKAFVAKMNARAAALGMARTRFADASGLSPQSVSTPEDLIRLGRAAMANPVLAAVVAQPEVELPLAGRLYNVNALLGQEGVAGIKTGSTEEAGGCLLFLARRQVGGQPVELYGAVLGQPTLADAFAAGRRLIAAAAAALRPVRVLEAGQPVAAYRAPWGGEVPIIAETEADLLGWPGMAAGASLRAAPADAPLEAGATVGALSLETGAAVREVGLRTAAALPPPPLLWRLMRLF